MSLEALLSLVLGGFFGILTVLHAQDRVHPHRWASTAFWGLLALLFLVGEWLPRRLVGLMVLGLALMAGAGRLKRTLGLVQEASRSLEAGRLLVPALLIPLLTAVGAWALGRWSLLSQGQATVVALVSACGLALGVACVSTRTPPDIAFEEGRRLLDAMGWAVVLPLLLAVLGAVFLQAGVGKALSGLLHAVFPLGHRWVALGVFAVGMTLLSGIMGNAFAAFPILMGGLGIPILVGQHGADPLALAAFGMLSGYCGTLLSPMAANFNLVPVMLLDLENPHAVIRAQAPTALGIWVLNFLFMSWAVFRI